LTRRRTPLAAAKSSRAAASPPRRKVSGATTPTRSISMRRKLRVRMISSTRSASIAVWLLRRRVTEEVCCVTSASRTVAVGTPSAGLAPDLRFSTMVASAPATDGV
jgi:hypothetical protein